MPSDRGSSDFTLKQQEGVCGDTLGQLLCTPGGVIKSEQRNGRSDSVAGTQIGVRQTNDGLLVFIIASCVTGDGALSAPGERSVCGVLTTSVEVSACSEVTCSCRDVSVKPILPQ